MASKKYESTGYSRTFTYVHCRRAARSALERALEMEDISIPGCMYFYMMAGTFAAFTVEAYLNDVGKRPIPDWATEELTLDAGERMQRVLRQLGAEVDMGRRPFQTWREMRKLRDSLAHGKTEDIKKTVASSSHDPVIPEPDWKCLSTRKAAERLVQDAEDIVRILHVEAGGRREEAFALTEIFSSNSRAKE